MADGESLQTHDNAQLDDDSKAPPIKKKIIQ